MLWGRLTNFCLKCPGQSMNTGVTEPFLLLLPGSGISSPPKCVSFLTWASLNLDWKLIYLGWLLIPSCVVTLLFYFILLLLLLSTVLIFSFLFTIYCKALWFTERVVVKGCINKEHLHLHKEIYNKIITRVFRNNWTYQSLAEGFWLFRNDAFQVPPLKFWSRFVSHP